MFFWAPNTPSPLQQAFTSFFLLGFEAAVRHPVRPILFVIFGVELDRGKAWRSRLPEAWGLSLRAAGTVCGHHLAAATRLRACFPIYRRRLGHRRDVPCSLKSSRPGDTAALQPPEHACSYLGLVLGSSFGLRRRSVKLAPLKPPGPGCLALTTPRLWPGCFAVARPRFWPYNDV